MGVGGFQGVFILVSLARKSLTLISPVIRPQLVEEFQRFNLRELHDLVFEGVDVFYINVLEDLILEGLAGELKGGEDLCFALPFADGVLCLERVWLCVLLLCFWFLGFIVGFVGVCPLLAVVDFLLGVWREDKA